MSGVNENLPKRVSQVINGTLAIGEIAEDLERLPETDDKKFLFAVFSQLVKGLNSKSSFFVDTSLKIIEELMSNPTEGIMSQFNGNDFQQALMYTLRGRTTRFGNKFSMHRDMWRNIEQRVLGFYQKWHQDSLEGEGRYPNIMKNYQDLCKLNIKFPETTILVIPQENQANGKQRNPVTAVNDTSFLEKEKERLETFLQEYGKMINEGFDCDIIDEIQYKVKEMLIHALNNVLLHENPSVRLQVAMDYNRRFNTLIQKLNEMKSKFREPKLTTLPSSKDFKSQGSIKEIVAVPTKTSGIRSIIKSTMAFISRQPKDSAERNKNISKMDETIGDLAKYFDNQEDVNTQKLPDLTQSSLY